MKFKTLGNYYLNSFHLPPLTGLDSSYTLIKKINPANLEETLWEAPIDSRHIVPVIESSEKGFQTWRKLSSNDRKNHISNVLKIIKNRENELSEAISLETGKPLWESHNEVDAFANNATYSLQEIDKIISSENYVENSLGENCSAKTIKKPLGPSLIITSYISPLLTSGTKIINALLSGCSVILKPSPKTLYTNQLLVECFHQAEFPVGVINLINGEKDITQRLLKEKVIKSISFTGSKEVGLKVLGSTYSDLSKNVSLFLGTKNTTTLHSDIDIDVTVDQLIEACYLSSGQNHLSTSIVSIHQSIHAEFISKFHQKAKTLIVDHPIEFKDKPFMGPLIDKKSVENYLLFVGMAKREGVEEIMRGKEITKSFIGHYVSPTIHFADKFINNCHFLTSEFLAPSCTFIKYSDIEEAIDISNKLEFGYSSSIYTKDQTIVEKYLDEINYGVINVNVPTTKSAYCLPNYGMKNSGNYMKGGTSFIDSNLHTISCLTSN